MHVLYAFTLAMALMQSPSPAVTPVQPYKVDIHSIPFPPVDPWFRVYVVLTFFTTIAALGTLGFLYRQSGIMRNQLLEMALAREQTDKMIKSAAEQVQEMRNAGLQTRELIEHAAIQAEALINAADTALTSAKATADVAEATKLTASATKDNLEMFINRERARIRIEVNPLKLHPPETPLGQTVTYKVLHYGPTDAFIVSTGHYAVVTSEPEPVVSGLALGLGVFPMDIPSVITATTVIPERYQFLFPEIRLEAETINAINQATKFAHFYGFITYNDVFGRERTTKFCYTWKADPKPIVSPYERWMKSGPPDANSES